MTLTLLAACGSAQPEDVVFHADSNPVTLADWNVLAIERGHLVPVGGSVVYDVSAPLSAQSNHSRSIDTTSPSTLLRI